MPTLNTSNSRELEPNDDIQDAINFIRGHDEYTMPSDAEARQAIQRLIVEARIDELKKYLEHYGDDYDRYADARILMLQASLNNKQETE